MEKKKELVGSLKGDNEKQTIFIRVVKTLAIFSSFNYKHNSLYFFRAAG